MLSETRLCQLLEPFGLNLSPAQVSQTLAYLDLLLHWNQKINLTAIRDPEECVQRHFAESMFIARYVPLEGTLLDIGSGAGFPGLALKIPFPDLSVTLLEPIAKKRAFLKEAARVCSFSQVHVRGERLEEFALTVPPPQFDIVTSRALGTLDRLVPLAADCLKPEGTLFLWATRNQGQGLRRMDRRLTWRDPLPIPLTRTSEIWCASKSA